MMNFILTGCERMLKRVLAVFMAMLTFASVCVVSAEEKEIFSADSQPTTVQKSTNL